jgi:hypothetical protein
VPLVVDQVRVPLAEQVVRPAVDRVPVVIGPRVEGELVHEGQVEPGVVLDVVRRLFEDADGQVH